MSGYFGSKAASGLFQNIIAMMPPHDTYIETHLGGGAVMKKKPPAVNNIGIDIDPEPLSNFDCAYPVHLVNGCAHHFLTRYDYTGTELIYCDPPYLPETRTSRRKYRFEYTKRDHVALLELLKSLPCHIILSGYPSLLYDDLLDDCGAGHLCFHGRADLRNRQRGSGGLLEAIRAPHTVHAPLSRHR